MSELAESIVYEKQHLLAHSGVISSEELLYINRDHLEGHQKYMASLAIGKTLVDRYFSYSHRIQFGEIYHTRVYVFGVDELETYKEFLRAEWEAERE